MPPKNGREGHQLRWRAGWSELQWLYAILSTRPIAVLTGVDLDPPTGVKVNYSPDHTT